MRLDPKKVRFVPPLVPLGLRGETLRFVGKENTVDLQETALVVEGNLLKAGLLGIELLFRRALAEWSAVTVPYSRITAVRYVRFPLLRLVAIGFLVLCVVGTVAIILEDPYWAMWAPFEFGVILLTAYLIIRVPARYVIRFRTRDGKRTRLMLQVKSKKLRAEFARRLAENREAAARFADRAGGASGPDSLAAPRPRTPLWLVIFTVLFLLAAGAFVPALVGIVGELYSRPGGVYGPSAGADDTGPSAGLGHGPAPEVIPVADITPETIGADDTGPPDRPGHGPAPKVMPVVEITAETIKAGLPGQTFTVPSGPGPVSKRWRVEPGEVRELAVLGSDSVGDSIRMVHVRITLEDRKQRLQGTLTLTYVRQPDGWLLGLVAPKIGPDGKALPFKVTDLK